MPQQLGGAGGELVAVGLLLLDLEDAGVGALLLFRRRQAGGEDAGLQFGDGLAEDRFEFAD